MGGLHLRELVEWVLQLGAQVERSESGVTLLSIVINYNDSTALTSVITDCILIIKRGNKVVENQMIHCSNI